MLSLKECLVVCVIALAVFRLTRPIAVIFIDPSDLVRRCRVWFLLTIAVFLAPNFWIIIGLAIVLTISAARKDSNPCALYLMLFAVLPPIEKPLPMIGMPYLLSINIFLVLSFCVLTPVAVRLYSSRRERKENALKATDFFLISYLLLSAALYVHALKPDGSMYPATFSDGLRRGFVFFFDAFIPYYAISRVASDRRKLQDMLATYALACTLLAGIAMFESIRHWYLYGEVAGRLGAEGSGVVYLMRGSSLRAMASTGHAMTLAHLLALAYGVWLYLQSRVESKRWKVGGSVVFWGGLLAAYTRGGWVGAALIYMLFPILSPQALSKLVKAVGVLMIVSTLIYFSPLGDKIVQVVPWLGGTVAVDSIDYRQRLWDRSWEIIEASPFLGDQSAMLKMQDLRQGEGIVDMVNAYAGILLDNGFVGLALFSGFVLLPLYGAWKRSRSSAQDDRDLSLLGASLVACIVATLVMYANTSFGGGGSARMFYVFIGLAAGYSTITQSSGRKAPACQGVLQQTVRARITAPVEQQS